MICLVGYSSWLVLSFLEMDGSSFFGGICLIILQLDEVAMCVYAVCMKNFTFAGSIYLIV